MKKIKFLAVALLAMSMAACGGNDKTADKADKSTETTEATETKTDDAAAPAAKDGVQQLTDDAAFRPDKKVDVVTVIDFNATWCVPCKKLTPAYDAAAKTFQGKVAFYSADFEKLPETAKAFDIKSVPTVYILSPDGKAQRFEGLGAFTKGVADNATPEDLTAGITKNLESLIEEALK